MTKKKPIDNEAVKKLFGERDDIFRPTVSRDTELQKAGITEKAKKKITDKFEKVTIYLDPDDILLLENIRAKRIKQGQRRSEVDMSKLIREAIKLLESWEAGKLELRK